MHGRVKIRSTEQQQEAKRRERSEKLQRHTAAMGRLLTKRAAGEYDGEALELTARVLTLNPDLHTLWNFRREILQQMQQHSSAEQLQACVEVELDLSAACLRASPKSYCAWHQRAWALALAPRPPWARELQLTGAFLQCDERNFHCWDHRRFVVARGRAELALRANAAAVTTPDDATADSATVADAATADADADAADDADDADADAADDADADAVDADADADGANADADAGTADADGANADADAADADADADGANADAGTADADADGADAALSFTDGAELAFTHGLLSSNFSNFSSWHYRAQQLALAGERPARPRADALPAEFELVQNAIFTDPDDQSAWLYHRWLLGRAEPAESVSCLYVSQSLQLALVVFTRPVNVLQEQQEVVLSVDGRPARGSWVTPDRRNRHSLVWLCLLKGPLRGGESVRVYWGDRPPKECVLGQGGGESWIRDEASEMGGASLGAGLSPDLDSALLQEQLRSCTELLGMEPENKWCLLALVLLMRALDPLLWERQCLLHLQTLARVDPARAACYRDTRSRLLLGNAVLTMEYADTRVVALPGRGLSTLCHLEQLVLVTHLNLSNNSLRCLPRALSCLQRLQVLEADNNEISSLPGVSYLLNLQELSLQNNRLCSMESLAPLAHCPRLTHVELSGNAVTLTAGFTLTTLLTSLTH